MHRFQSDGDDYPDDYDELYEEIKEYPYNTGKRYIEGDTIFYQEVIYTYVDCSFR